MTITAPPWPSTMPQEETSPQGQGLDMGGIGSMGDLFQEIFDQAEQEVIKVYLSGAIANAREHHKRIYSNILFTEKRVNELWLRMRQGENVLDQFKGAVKAWEEVCFKATEVFRKEKEEPEQGNLL